MTPSDDESVESLVEQFDRGRETSTRSGATTVAQWKRLALPALALIAALAAMTWLALRFAGAPPNYAADSRRITVKDAESGEVFKDFRIREGQSEPYAHPGTGRRTLYSPEYCYWNADGTAKTEPTYVILNQKLGKQGPTTCPDCGRRVVRHNPEPPVEVMVEAFQREKGG